MVQGTEHGAGHGAAVVDCQTGNGCGIHNIACTCGRQDRRRGLHPGGDCQTGNVGTVTSACRRHPVGDFRGNGFPVRQGGRPDRIKRKRQGRGQVQVFRYHQGPDKSPVPPDSFPLRVFLLLHHIIQEIRHCHRHSEIRDAWMWTPQNG